MTKKIQIAVSATSTLFNYAQAAFLTKSSYLRKYQGFVLMNNNAVL